MLGGEHETCMVCEGANLAGCYTSGSRIGQDNLAFYCSACGYYEVDRLGILSFSAYSQQLTRSKRAALSHLIRTNAKAGKVFVINRANLHNLIDTVVLPPAATQAQNLVSAVGDYSAAYGDGHPVKEPELIAMCGAISDKALERIMTELYDRGLIYEPQRSQVEENNFLGGVTAWGLSLTLKGHDAYDRLQRGETLSFSEGGNITGSKHTTLNVHGNVGSYVETATNSVVIGVVGDLKMDRIERLLQQCPAMINELPEEEQVRANAELSKIQDEMNGQRRPDILKGILTELGKIAAGVRDNMAASAITGYLAAEFGINFFGG
ncbi:hypothetical protein [Asticcacaulis excentricus]|nr:hypothetical protein [Asticcacaulis excentricus]